MKTILRAVLPRAVYETLHCYRILSQQFGHYRSMKTGNAIDAQGRPIPWYTYPALEYIEQLDFSSCSVCEYGSGNSTLYWMERCRRLVSIERDEKWYERVRPRIANRVEYILAPGDGYVPAIDRFNEAFDIIIIDGPARYECARRARPKLARGGMIILDNSDWRERTTEFLRNSGLLEVDMAGFGPINAYTWTTSFFFDRTAQFAPRRDRQPVHGIGAVLHREKVGSDGASKVVHQGADFDSEP